MRQVELSGDVVTPQIVCLRQIAGTDELAVPSPDATGAITLLRRLARSRNGDAVALEQLTASQIDRLLASVYDMLYGDKVECRAHCRSCTQGYEFELSLTEIISTQDASRPGPPDADGA